MKKKLINVIGLGYIGLPTAALLATKGYSVAGTDISEKTVNVINQGKSHFAEPELDLLVKSAILNGHLECSTLPNTPIYT